MISARAYRPFALLLLLDTAAFLLQKLASTQAHGDTTEYYKSPLLHPWVWLALALGPCQLWLWTRILRRTDLSLAYPLTSLSYPATMLCTTLLFHEHLPPPVWIGGAFITFGVALLAEPESEPVRKAPTEQPTPAQSERTS